MLRFVRVPYGAFADERQKKRNRHRHAELGILGSRSRHICPQQVQIPHYAHVGTAAQVVMAHSGVKASPCFLCLSERSLGVLPLEARLILCDAFISRISNILERSEYILENPDPGRPSAEANENHKQTRARHPGLESAQQLSRPFYLCRSTHCHEWIFLSSITRLALLRRLPRARSCVFINLVPPARPQPCSQDRRNIHRVLFRACTSDAGVVEASENKTRRKQT